MKEKKKVKRFKRILPFICATLLLLGSCMTVCASSSAPAPTDDTYCYYVEIAEKGKNTPYCIYYSNTPFFYRDSIGVCTNSSTYYYALCTDGVWADTVTYKNRGTTNSAFCIALDSTYDVLYSNYDILYESSDTVFFHPLLIALARTLPGVVMNQVGLILPIVVGCLALLIGSLILVPKLKIFVLK